MLNSYRFAVVLMVLFGAVGIHAARHQSTSQLADTSGCTSNQPDALTKKAIAQAQSDRNGVQTAPDAIPVSRVQHPAEKEVATPALASTGSL